MTALVGVPEIAGMLGVSSQRVYQLARHAPGFPEPAAPGPPRLYRREEAERWAAEYRGGRQYEALSCDHQGPAVSAGRCWDCHLADLRARGDSARADRLVRLKELQDEGRLNWNRLVLDLVESFERGVVEDHASAEVDHEMEPKGSARWRV